MAATLPPPRLLPSGDSAVTVEFSRTIDEDANQRVLALDKALSASPIDGLIETVPTYRSLLVHYDPIAIDFTSLKTALLDLAGDLPESAQDGRLWRIPVVYGDEFGIDLEETAKRHAITSEELIRRHAAPVYRVYMIGFLPGFVYLGGLDPSIATSRRESPRPSLPAGNISIGGVQALIASIEAPSGWHMLGRTPVRNFMLGRDPVFILQPGDRVKFEAVAAERWDALDRAAEAEFRMKQTGPDADTICREALFAIAAMMSSR
jgi:KipI family sensor histidine kinase inhibitor